MISTARRVEYAYGYIELGLLDAARSELAAIVGDERYFVSVSRVQVELHMAGKQWNDVIVHATHVIATNPEIHDVWVAWAYALRELNRVAEALEVLGRGVLLHGSEHAVFHYNLGCYHCLLGDQVAAKRALKQACLMDESFRASALEDRDYEAIWPELRRRGSSKK